jgi:anti-sigma factor RsiW
MTKPEIDPERIAALLDGRLSGHEREVLLSELASSPEQLALLADASMIAQELRLNSSSPDSGPAADNRDGVRRLVATEAAAPQPSLIKARQRRWTPAWSAAVAAALLIVIAPWVLRRAGFRSESAAPGGSSIARVEPSIPVGWDGTPWSVTRGASAALTPKARAVRVGARLADLELTIVAGDSAARGIVDDVIALVEGVPLSGSVTQVYEALRDSIGVAPSQLTPLVQRGYDGVSALLGRSDVALGTWLETARIAAARKNSAFFTSAQTRQMLRDLNATALDQQTQGALSRVAAMLPVSTATDWSSLEAETTELLRASAR